VRRQYCNILANLNKQQFHISTSILLVAKHTVGKGAHSKESSPNVGLALSCHEWRTEATFLLPTNDAMMADELRPKLLQPLQHHHSLAAIVILLKAIFSSKLWILYSF
jgi:hypothetical protein